MKEVNNTKEKNAYKETYYSIHTFEVEIELDKEKYEYYKELFSKFYLYNLNSMRTAYHNRQYYLQTMNKNKFSKIEITCYDCVHLYLKGISNIQLNVVRESEGIYKGAIIKSYISFKVNPIMFRDDCIYKYICIIPGEELKNVMPDMKALLSVCGFKENDIETAKLKRIDICTNINLETQQRVVRYLQLLRKGRVVRGLTEKVMEYDKKAHRKVYPENEVKFVNSANDSSRQVLSIYDKYSQMKQKEKFYIQYAQLDLLNATGQVRIELRINYSKIRYLVEKYHLEKSNELIAKGYVLGEDILEGYLRRIYGEGKMIAYSDAKEMIINSGYRKETKMKMIAIVEMTKKEDMNAALATLENLGYILEKFNELGISPITTPDSWKEEYENIITYIKTKNVNQRDWEKIYCDNRKDIFNFHNI